MHVRCMDGCTLCTGIYMNVRMSNKTLLSTRAAGSTPRSTKYETHTEEGEGEGGAPSMVVEAVAPSFSISSSSVVLTVLLLTSYVRG